MQVLYWKLECATHKTKKENENETVDEDGHCGGYLLGGIWIALADVCMDGIKCSKIHVVRRIWGLPLGTILFRCFIYRNRIVVSGIICHRVNWRLFFSWQ